MYFEALDELTYVLLSQMSGIVNLNLLYRSYCSFFHFRLLLRNQVHCHLQVDLFLYDSSKSIVWGHHIHSHFPGVLIQYAMLFFNYQQLKSNGSSNRRSLIVRKELWNFYLLKGHKAKSRNQFHGVR